MEHVASFPYVSVEIDKNGKIHNAGDIARVTGFVSTSGITDVCVVSHGWNNNTAEARSLYDKLFTSVDAVVKSGTIAGMDGRVLGVVGVLWPSKRFTDKDLIPGGGAASAGAGDETQAEVNTLLDELESALDSHEASQAIDAARNAAKTLDSESASRKAFVESIRSLLPRDAVSQDDGSDQFFSTSPEEMFSRLEAPIRFRRPTSSQGGAAGGVSSVMAGGGGAAGLGDFFRGRLAAARRILNFTTYYLMKSRSGAVGSIGVSQLVSAIKKSHQEVRIHLVGHSFGGRVVASTALALAGIAPTRPSSMTLLQAAFSHNGFAEKFDGGRDGHFRSVMTGNAIDGPILVTHTMNDSANAKAYPIASRIGGQDSASLVGGPGDRFGAIGANGTQHTPEAESANLLGLNEGAYEFQKGKIYNLLADKHIADHGDVHGEAAARAVVCAIACT